jgi:hypothetical protein
VALACQTYGEHLLLESTSSAGGNGGMLAAGGDPGLSEGGGGGDTGDTGGAGGQASQSGGAAGSGDPVGGVSVEWVDDMEDGDEQILMLGGRTGAWFSYSDGRGVLVPDEGDPVTMSAVNGRLNSFLGLHVTAVGFSDPASEADFGAGFGCNFSVRGGRQPYNASQYSGISFYGRAANEVTLLVLLPTPQTEVDAGCIHCQTEYSTEIVVTSEWQEFSLPFSEFFLGADGGADSVDPAHIYGVSFQRAGDFNVWIDDVKFVP